VYDQVEIVLHHRVIRGEEALAVVLAGGGREAQAVAGAPIGGKVRVRPIGLTSPPAMKR
jgi:hypothetical protein